MLQEKTYSLQYADVTQNNLCQRKRWRNLRCEKKFAVSKELSRGDQV